jgi:catechol 2,3-dioxygenase-like lactoylglutathione lyase family enzyme
MNDTAPTGVLSLSHVALRASDIERSVAFYRDVLGYDEASRLHHGDGVLMLVNMRVSELQWIELFDARGLSPDGGRIHQIAFRTADAEALRRFLLGCGFDVPGECPRGQMGNAYLIVRSPDGVDIEFVEYLPAAWPLRDPSGHLPARRLSSRILRIGVEMRDPQASRAFYLGQLGLTETASGTWAIPGHEPCLQPSASPVTAPCFVLAVPDLGRALARLVEAGHQMTSGEAPCIHQEDGGERRIELFDPDGFCVQLVERLATVDEQVRSR